MREIADELVRGDLGLLESYLIDQYEIAHVHGKYLGKAKVAMAMSKDVDEQLLNLENALKKLYHLSKFRFGDEVSYVTFLGGELLPNKLILELWGFKWIS